MDVIKKIKNYIYGDAAIKEYNLELLLKTICVASYLDGKVVNIEYIEAMLLLEEFIKQNKIEMDKKRKKNIKQWFETSFIDRIQRYKKDEKFFNRDRAAVFSSLIQEKNTELLYFLKNVIEIDKKITKEEFSFLSKIEKAKKEKDK